MPYVSQAQQGFFHSPAAKKAGISQATVEEFDAASKGQHGLPEHVGDKKGSPHAHDPAKPHFRSKAQLEHLKKNPHRIGGAHKVAAWLANTKDPDALPDRAGSVKGSAKPPSPLQALAQKLK